MESKPLRPFVSSGDGTDFQGRLAAISADAMVASGVRIFHPENVRIGEKSFIGCGAFIDGYHNGFVHVGPGAWIGPMVYLHGAGGIEIGAAVGIGPRVTIITSQHTAAGSGPVLHTPLSFGKVTVEEGADIGVCATLLPGVTIGRGAVVGAGAVVTRSVPPMAVAAGNPARVLRRRGE